MIKDSDGLDFLKSFGLRLELKFNLCGFFEYHVINNEGQTIAKDTVAKNAINQARNTFQA